MEDWVLKAVVPAVITGIGGWWAHWSWVRKERVKADLHQKQQQADFEQKQRDADLREQQRQAEYDQFKKKRRLIGAGEVEKMERADKLTDLIIKQKTHQITRDEFNAFKDDLIAGRKPRHGFSDTIGPSMIKEKVEAFQVPEGQGKFPAEFFVRMADFDPRLTEEQKLLLARRLLAVLRERGPNDYPVGYDGDGHKVEWLPSDPEEIAEGAEPFWPMPLLRNEDEIHAAAEEFFEKVWWNRHQIWLEKIDSGEEKVTEDQKSILETAKKKAKEIEDKYGRDNLGWDDFDWGMVNGKLSALRWVGGSEWDFLDT